MAKQRFVFCRECMKLVDVKTPCDHFSDDRKKSNLSFPAIHIFKPFFSEFHDPVPQWINSKKQEKALMKKNRLEHKE